MSNAKRDHAASSILINELMAFAAVATIAMLLDLHLKRSQALTYLLPTAVSCYLHAVLCHMLGRLDLLMLSLRCVSSYATPVAGLALESL